MKLMCRISTGALRSLGISSRASRRFQNVSRIIPRPCCVSVRLFERSEPSLEFGHLNRFHKAGDDAAQAFGFARQKLATGQALSNHAKSRSRIRASFEPRQFEG